VQKLPFQAVLNLRTTDSYLVLVAALGSYVQENELKAAEEDRRSQSQIAEAPEVREALRMAAHHRTMADLARSLLVDLGQQFTR